ncbi:hypothetical protein BOTBODRAFT_50333 [Botryobasidium botryosum FD-172 SS1]|uniref:Lysine-specific metallo-endopeptidase domain-containing protein n=1 Tax=Botryobasidium botryosum (strain FD-172 SS1) TaxID=930990 RepID=A0A067NDB0_BOTB1|nr:hypothetical protein BOTBODRAFT_50333 [Botryobasidium botryosum FD-172 SS1]
MAVYTLTALLLSLLMGPTSAAPSLSIAVSGPSSVDGLSNLKVATTIHNTGDEPLRLLNDPRSLLTPSWATNVFSISKTDGSARPDFRGVKVKWSPSLAAQSNDVTTVAPGQSVEFTHDLSTTYDFAAAGAGTYNFHALDTFTHVDAAGNLVSLKASLTSPASLKLSGNLAVVPSTPSSAKFTKRAKFVGCSADQQTQINAAIPAAQKYAGDALTYLKSQSSATPRFTTWFGSYTSASKDLVTTHYTGISGGQFSTFTYDCSCTEANTFAFVEPDKYGYINLCDAFWTAPVTGTDSKGGTLVHECSHFTKNGATQDYTYGQASCQSLAKSDPAQATMNADSHEYFAENNLAQE